MSKKFNNRNLLIILVVLAGIFVVARMTKFRNANQTLNTDIVAIDTSKVSAIHLFPASEKGEEVRIIKKGDLWTVSKGDISAPADPAAVEYALNDLLNLKTEQLVARSEEKWADYHVNDSLGTRVMIKEGRKTTLDLVVGRFDYKPTQNPYGGGYGGYGQNQGTGITYVRSHGSDEVYAVESFLSMTFNRGFSSWRDQTVTSFTPSQVNRIVFDYPADSGFFAQRSGHAWMVGGLQADSTAMASYLNSASRQRASSFIDGFTTSALPDYQVTFEGESMQPVSVKAFTQPDGSYVMHSSINPESWFSIPEDAMLITDLFKGIEALTQ